jgi:NAD-dependent dihydropyrimidine dehydrogenase PreA subunit
VAYVISEACVETKDASCVEVCPVDCIHPFAGEPGYAEASQLFIDPAECIDCDACVSACPVEACMHESEASSEAVQRNAEYFKRA